MLNKLDNAMMLALQPLITIISRFKTLVACYQRMFPQLEVDVDAELTRYSNYADQIRSLVTETVSYVHRAVKKGQKVLVEGANAAMLDIDFGTINREHEFYFHFERKRYQT